MSASARTSYRTRRRLRRARRMGSGKWRAGCCTACAALVGSRRTSSPTAQPSPRANSVVSGCEQCSSSKRWRRRASRRVWSRTARRSLHAPKGARGSGRSACCCACPLWARRPIRSRTTRRSRLAHVRASGELRSRSCSECALRPARWWTTHGAAAGGAADAAAAEGGEGEGLQLHRRLRGRRRSRRPSVTTPRSWHAHVAAFGKRLSPSCSVCAPMGYPPTSSRTIPSWTPSRATRSGRWRCSCWQRCGGWGRTSHSRRQSRSVLR